MTYTGPSEAEVVDHFEAGTGVSISATGEIAIGQPVATTDDVTFNTVTADLDGQVLTATQNSITSAPNLATVGTITSGTWNGTSLTDAYVDDNLTINNGDIDNSSIDASVIGANSAAAGTFTTATATTITDGTASMSAGAISGATSVDGSGGLDYGFYHHDWIRCRCWRQYRCRRKP